MFATISWWNKILNINLRSTAVNNNLAWSMLLYCTCTKLKTLRKQKPTSMKSPKKIFEKVCKCNVIGNRKSTVEMTSWSFYLGCTVSANNNLMRFWFCEFLRQVRRWCIYQLNMTFKFHSYSICICRFRWNWSELAVLLCLIYSASLSLLSVSPEKVLVAS